MHAVVITLGDLGRSPRMQYHARSLAQMRETRRVTAIGYEGEACMLGVMNSPKVHEVRLSPIKLDGLSFIPSIQALCKGVILLFNLMVTLFSLPRYDIVIIQNPPALPAIMAALIVSFMANDSLLCLDWHNLGFSMFEERHGPGHPLVSLSRFLERTLAGFCHCHICVSQTMANYLEHDFGLPPFGGKAMRIVEEFCARDGVRLASDGSGGQIADILHAREHFFPALLGPLGEGEGEAVVGGGGDGGRGEGMQPAESSAGPESLSTKRRSKWKRRTLAPSPAGVQVVYDRPADIFTGGVPSASQRHMLLESLGYRDLALFPHLYSPGVNDAFFSAATTAQTRCVGAPSHAHIAVAAASEAVGEDQESSPGHLWDGPPAWACSTLTLGSEKTHFCMRGDRAALVVSSTSWTEDEDFDLLVDALLELDVQLRSRFPHASDRDWDPNGHGSERIARELRLGSVSERPGTGTGTGTCAGSSPGHEAPRTPQYESFGFRTEDEFGQLQLPHSRRPSGADVCSPMGSFSSSSSRPAPLDMFAGDDGGTTGPSVTPSTPSRNRGDASRSVSDTPRRTFIVGRISLSPGAVLQANRDSDTFSNSPQASQVDSRAAARASALHDDEEANLGARSDRDREEGSRMSLPLPPRVVVVITGKGPLKEHYKAVFRQLERRMTRVAIRMPWLKASEYPLLMRCADLGVCLHTSTSGLDLPMKVLDMLGSGVPVVACDFPALPELVRHKQNGLVFHATVGGPAQQQQQQQPNGKSAAQKRATAVLAQRRRWRGLTHRSRQRFTPSSSSRSETLPALADALEVLLCDWFQQTQGFEPSASPGSVSLLESSQPSPVLALIHSRGSSSSNRRHGHGSRNSDSGSDSGSDSDSNPETEGVLYKRTIEGGYRRVVQTQTQMQTQTDASALASDALSEARREGLSALGQLKRTVRVPGPGWDEEWERAARPVVLEMLLMRLEGPNIVISTVRLVIYCCLYVVLVRGLYLGWKAAWIQVEPFFVYWVGTLLGLGPENLTGLGAGAGVGTLAQVREANNALLLRRGSSALFAGRQVALGGGGIWHPQPGRWLDEAVASVARVWCACRAHWAASVDALEL